MTKTERFMKARKAVFELQETVLDVLIEAKQSNPQSAALHPAEIGKRVGIGGYAYNYSGGGNDWSIVYGVLDSLMSERQITKTADGAMLVVDVD